jgi:hypothetical protein
MTPRALRSFLAFVAGGWLAVACGGSSVDSRRTSCATDADCASGQRCTAGAVRPILGVSPCEQVVACETGAECRPDEVCAPSWQRQVSYVETCAPKLCAPSCSVSRCPPDAECGDDGVCSLTLCDAPGAAACPALWGCDPAAAKTASHAAYEGIEGGEQDIERQMARGCVRLPCDAKGGRMCAPAWACKPSATDNPSGCAPDDCRKTGRCSDDARLVCADLATHPEAQMPDVNGCVVRTCDDGHSCAWLTVTGVDVGRCNYGAPEADALGCVVLPCEVDADCGYEDQLCDHASRLSDDRGCRLRSCTEGQPCGLGLVCAPEADIHGADDCALPAEAMTGGTGGGAGSAGTSGTTGGMSPGGAGGSAAGPGGGTGPLAVPRGECVAR